MTFTAIEEREGGVDGYIKQVQQREEKITSQRWKYRSESYFQQQGQIIVNVSVASIAAKIFFVVSPLE